MAASLSITPSTGIVATKTVCRVDVAGADQNNAAGYNPAIYPTSPEKRYRLRFVLGTDVLGQSYEFGVDETGGHRFDNYIFPESGNWTIELVDEAAATAASLPVVVS